MTEFSRRSLVACALALAVLASTPLAAADNPKEIYVDWATYNPVSMLLKDKGFLEKEFAKDGIKVVWVQTNSSSNALQFLNAGSINFGSTAGSAALVARINGNPIKSVYVYSRPEWTALVATKDSAINKVADLKGKKVAMVRGTDPHIFTVRALLAAGLSDKDITPVLVQQHADGGNLLIRGDVDAWAGLDPMMAQHEVNEGARLFYRNRDANTWGILNVREEFAKDHPDIVRRVISAYEEARKYSLANYDELKKTFIAVTKLPDAGRYQAARCRRRQAAQGAHRAHPQQGRPGATRIDPRSRPCAAEGGRDRRQCRRQEVGRRPHRRSLRDGRELIRNPPDRLQPSSPRTRGPIFQRRWLWVPATGSPRRKRRGVPLAGTTVHELTSRIRYDVCAPRVAFRESGLVILHWKAVPCLLSP